MSSASLGSSQSGGVDGVSPSLWLLSSIPPPSTSVMGTHRVPFLQLRVCEGSGTSRRSGQDGGEKSLGDG